MENNKLKEILISNDIKNSIEQNMDFLLYMIPEIKYMIGFNQNHPHHHLDVWNHTLLALCNSDNDFEIRLSLLLHDIGKPFSYQDAEVRHFKGHALKSEEMAASILKRLNYDEKFIKRILYLIRYHDEIIDIEKINDYELEIKRLKVQYADALAHHPNKVLKRIETLDEISKKIYLKEKSYEKK